MTRHLVGLISDTHGLVRPEVHRLLEGVELILHAGDVGSGGVLEELATIAPVRAVRGNIDDPWDARLADQLAGDLHGVPYRVTHGHELGSPTPAGLLARYPERLVVFGHTHRALVTKRGDRLVVNPGSAGHRRFGLGPSLALLEIAGPELAARIVEIPASR